VQARGNGIPLIVTGNGGCFMNDPKFQCCICFGHFSGYGNNPDPVCDDKTERCCDKCDVKFVQAARSGCRPDEVYEVGERILEEFLALLQKLHGALLQAGDLRNADLVNKSIQRLSA
jgi:hypothetical protein